MKRNGPDVPKDAVRTIHVKALARVEGEGSLMIRLKGNRATEVQLRIFEPPRFFEAFLRGRSHAEAPDLTARICGICPVAYQMSSCGAIENALDLRVDERVRALRRLLYCGEWIESHALHVFLLNAPDFLGYPDALAMAKEHADAIKRGLQIKKAGNAIVARVGGREIHPINVRIGGFYRAPTRGELEALLPDIEGAMRAARDSLAWAAGFSFPEREHDYEFVSLRHADEYPLCEGRIVSSKGIDIQPSDFDGTIVEDQVAHSTALHARIRQRGAYLCGPLARFNMNFDRLSSDAKDAARLVGLSAPCNNPFKSILVRLVEILYALEEAHRIIDRYIPPDPPFVEPAPRAGRGFGCTEAPRGLLYHSYTLDAQGTITSARIVPPTSQNQKTIEEDLFRIAPWLAELPHAEATSRAEQMVRSYDPCISCSTHFLDLRIERD